MKKKTNIGGNSSNFCIACIPTLGGVGSYLLMIAMAGLFWACHSNNTQKESEDFKIKTFTYEDSDNDAELEYNVDYPTGKSVVADSVRVFIAKILGGSENMDEAEAFIDDGCELVNHFGKINFQALSESHASDSGTSDEDSDDEDRFLLPSYASSIEITLVADEPNYVSYTVSGDNYYGGVHGLPFMWGVTFSKADGKQLGNPLKDTSKAEFQRLLVEGVKDYFNENGGDIDNDDDLAEWLLVAPFEIAEPGNDPFLTPEGLRFIYCAYEIAPFAAGMPEFTIPYDKIRPFLLRKALRLADE